MGQFKIVRQSDPALHGGNVVREKEAERVEMAEGSGLPAIQFSVHGFAVVLDEVETVLLREALQDIQRRGIAKDANRHDGASAGCEGALEFAHVHVEGRQLHVDEAQLEPILL